MAEKTLRQQLDLLLRLFAIENSNIEKKDIAKTREKYLEIILEAIERKYNGHPL